MSNRTNDEKLRILQERLAQIKQKQDTSLLSIKQRESVIEIGNPKDEEPKIKPLNLFWIKRTLLIGSVAYGIFYAYTNIDFNSFSTYFSSEEISETITLPNLEYNLNLEGDNIAIISSFDDESSAKALVNNLKVKGFKTNYFFLPNKSNSTKEVYQVFIGPYENEYETSQWIQNIDRKVAVLSLSKGKIYREMKSDMLIAKEKDEQVKKKKKEQEKIEKNLNWKCNKCNEENQNIFTICWKCNKEKSLL
jgi:hypothetical protein